MYTLSFGVLDIPLHLIFKNIFNMPKIKSNSGAKKRFKVTGSGKVKRYSANHRHLMRKKSSRQKGLSLGSTLVDEADAPRIKTLLGIGSNH
jgi:large subunit ribosomal protein L35